MASWLVSVEALRTRLDENVAACRAPVPLTDTDALGAPIAVPISDADAGSAHISTAPAARPAPPPTPATASLPSWEHVLLPVDMSSSDDLRGDLSHLLDEHSQEEDMAARMRTFEDTMRAEAQAAYRAEMTEIEQRFSSDLSRKRARCEAVLAEADSAMESSAFCQHIVEEIFNFSGYARPPYPCTLR